MRYTHVGLLILACLTITACASTKDRGDSLFPLRYPENGYEHMQNHKIAITIQGDSLNGCRSMHIDVEPVNKLYMRQQPPMRLQLWDDDLARPIMMDRAKYVTRRGGVRMIGQDQMPRFFSKYYRLENELYQLFFDIGLTSTKTMPCDWFTR